MFAPNSIKTLISIKNYNQLDQGKDITNKRSNSIVIDKTADHDKEDDKDFSPKSSRNMLEKVVNTKVLIKEIDNKLNDLKKWKHNQKKELEMNLAHNKKMLDPITDNSMPQENHFHEEYVQKLEDMMDLYKSDLEEARKVAKNQDISHSRLMDDINIKLMARENKITELSSQLSIYENQKSMSAQAPDFTGDIQALKNSLDVSRKDYSQLLRKSQKEVNNGVNADAMELNKKNLQEFVEKERKEFTKEKNYDFKNDIDDIEKELQELEEMLNCS